ncbi:hypothetical protein E4U58_002590 [Claviceps cyperi]|nr:hypothetical protein E4U58_002590 [Claviceps cyperi]
MRPPLPCRPHCAVETLGGWHRKSKDVNMTRLSMHRGVGGLNVGSLVRFSSSLISPPLHPSPPFTSITIIFIGHHSSAYVKDSSIHCHSRHLFNPYFYGLPPSPPSSPSQLSWQLPLSALLTAAAQIASRN